MSTRPNVLFICSRNEWRSRTAETLFRNSQQMSVKSAGTSKTARIRVSRSLIDWSEIIFVMEPKHRTILQDQFGEALMGKRLIVLDIPDEYRYMDEDLVRELEEVVGYYLG